MSEVKAPWFPTCDAGVAHDAMIHLWPANVGVDYRYVYPEQTGRVWSETTGQSRNPYPIMREEGLVSAIRMIELKTSFNGCYEKVENAYRRKAAGEKGVHLRGLRLQPLAGTAVVGVGANGMGECAGVKGVGVKLATTYEAVVEVECWLPEIASTTFQKGTTIDYVSGWQQGKLVVARVVADGDIGIMLASGEFKKLSELEVGEVVRVLVGTDEWIKYRPLIKCHPDRKGSGSLEANLADIRHWAALGVSPVWLAAAFGQSQNSIGAELAHNPVRSVGAEAFQRRKALTLELRVTSIKWQGVEEVYGLHIAPNRTLTRSVTPRGYSAGGFIVRSATLKGLPEELSP